MRIDLLLKYLCLVKSRSIAKSLCENGTVRVGGRSVRPSTSVKAGDHLTLGKRGGILEVVILQIPNKQLSRSLASQYYERIKWTPNDGFEADAEEDGF